MSQKTQQEWNACMFFGQRNGIAQTCSEPAIQVCTIEVPLECVGIMNLMLCREHCKVIAIKALGAP